MTRSKAVLLTCVSLVIAAAILQTVRAQRLRFEVDATDSADAQLIRLDEEIAVLEARVSAVPRPAGDELDHEDRLAGFAEAIGRAIGSSGADLARLSTDVDERSVSISAEGTPFAVATLLPRLDALLAVHAVEARRFTLAAGQDNTTRITVSVVPGGSEPDLPDDPRSAPSVGTERVARALRPARTTVVPSIERPAAREEPTTITGLSLPVSATVSWIGTAGEGDGERFVLRFDEDDVVAVLGAGDAPVLGWRVLGRDDRVLRMMKEGVSYEVRR